MNTWDAYKATDESIRSAAAAVVTASTAVSDHVEHSRPITSQWLAPHVTQMRLHIGFLASAITQLEKIEALEARRHLSEIPDSPLTISS